MYAYPGVSHGCIFRLDLMLQGPEEFAQYMPKGRGP